MATYSLVQFGVLVELGAWDVSKSGRIGPWKWTKGQWSLEPSEGTHSCSGNGSY